tara:strand:+ start:1684 stop:3336 length:1653 start_codon:yes stop_codon:yes gene_type:complete
MHIKAFKIIIFYKFKKYYKSLKIFVKIILLKLKRNKNNINSNSLRKLSLSYLNNWGRYKTYKKNNKNILVDCMWNNPNYWLRYILVRNALKLYKSNQYAIFGEYSLKIENLICSTFKFNSLGSLFHQSKPKPIHINKALLILSEIDSAQKFLDIKLPYSFPASVLYDGILKKQNNATLDLKDFNLPYYLAECISYLDNANKLFEKISFDIVLLSHCQEYSYAALAWLATKRGIPTYVLYGGFGTCRFFYLSKQDDIFSFPNRPNLEEIKDLSKTKRKDLIFEGHKLIHERFDGKTNDPGSLLAFIKRKEKINKTKICSKYNWDKKKSIIGVYCSNWFDYPHGSGLQSYTDFKDWIDSVLDIAKFNDSVNWIFKSHPCDAIYPSLKGYTINDLVNKINIKHIKVASEKWNGKDLINSLDGITTCHGTVGLEATILGKPVLVPYNGWYGELGFVINALNKKQYLKLLNSDWYLNIPKKNKINLCAITSAIYFGKTKGQRFIFEDDIEQEKIYLNLINNIIEYKVDLKKEVEMLKDWFKSKNKYYQVFKKINY